MRKRLPGSLVALLAVAVIAAVSLYVSAGGAQPTRAHVRVSEYSLELSGPASDEVFGTPINIAASIGHDGVTNPDECVVDYGTGFPVWPHGCYYGVQWELLYDPTIVSIDITATLPDPSAPAGCFQKQDYAPGIAYVGCTTVNSTQSMVYHGTAWNISAQCVGDGLTSLRLGPNSAVFALVGYKLPVHTHDTALDCIDPNATVTPTPSNTPTPTSTGTPTATHTPTVTRTPAPTPEVPLPNAFVINPSTCLTLTLNTACLAGLADSGLFTQGARLNFSGLLDRDDDGALTKEEVNAFAPFSGNQLHQKDGALVVVVFVENDAPVAFQTSEGGFKVDPFTVTNEFTCQIPPDDPVLGNTLYADEDCDDDGVRGDGVLYAQLLANGDVRGPGTIEVFGTMTGEVIGDASFEIVGEPTFVHAGPFETVLQAGLHPGDCTLPANASGFLDALGAAEKTIILGQVQDDEGRAITGGWIGWESSDTSVLRAASPSGPSLDLGTFGIAAPNILCGLQPGKATITLDLEVGPRFGASVLVVDPYAQPAMASIEITVLPPAHSLALSVVPEQAACGGGLVEVRALVTNVDGDPAVDGTPVTFTVGTSVTTLTTEDGIARITVTPSAAGVLVSASVPVGSLTLPSDLNSDGIDNDLDSGLEPDGLDDDGDGLVDEFGDAVDEGDEFDASIRVPNPNVIPGSMIVRCTEPTPTHTPTATPTDTPVPPTQTPTATATPPGCVADLNADGRVNGLDVATVARNLSRQNLVADLNGDGKVSLLDLRLVIKATRNPGC